MGPFVALSVFVLAWGEFEDVAVRLILITLQEVLGALDSLEDQGFIELVLGSRGLLALNHRVLNKGCSKSGLFDEASKDFLVEFDLVDFQSLAGLFQNGQTIEININP